MGKGRALRYVTSQSVRVILSRLWRKLRSAADYTCAGFEKRIAERAPVELDLRLL